MGRRQGEPSKKVALGEEASGVLGVVMVGVVPPPMSVRSSWFE